MRRFSELNLPMIGVIGTVWTILMMGLALNSGSIVAAFQGGEYSAAFAEASGLQEGDPVRISGVNVGKVSSVELDGTHVKVEFSANGIPLGSETTAEVKTESGLGSKFLGLVPRGDGELEPGSEIPLARTRASYDMTEVLADVTVNTGKIDTTRLSRALDSLSDTFANTPAGVRDTLDGVRRLSESVASRDDALRGVLTHADSVTGVLAERNADVIHVLSSGNALLEELEIRRETLHQLLVGVERLTTQLSALVAENGTTLKPALAELRRSLKVLNAHAADIDASIAQIGGYGRSLMEAVGGGPFFYGYIVNLIPTGLAPQLPGLFGAGAGGVR